MGDGRIVTLTRWVPDRRHGRIRWVVAATFVSIGGDEPRCVDYRVRVLPARPDQSLTDDVIELDRATAKITGAAMTSAEAADLGVIPPEGIPRYVFEVASQAKMLEGFRDAHERGVREFKPAVVDMLRRVPVSRSGKARRGRPPAIPLGTKLRILADVEAAYAQGGSRAEVAKAHNMSESSLRDLLTWARHVAEPQLFTGRPGKREGRMTDAARQLLKEGEGADRG